MRITMNNIYGGILTNLNKLTDDMSKLNENISSGKKFTRPSDDPIGLVSAMEIRTVMDEITQYERNIDHGASWLENSELALKQTQDIISHAKQLAVQMANSTQNAATRTSAAQEIDQLIEQVVALGSTQMNGKYIFGGQKTDEVPFTYDSAAGTVTYNGDDHDVNVRIGRNNSITINRTGRDAFMGGNDAQNLFTYLIGLKQALEANDVTGIKTNMGNLDLADDYLTEKISSFGAKQNRLDLKKSLYAEMQLNNTEKLSDTEDTDIAEAMMNLKTKEVAYQATLTAASKVMQLSLVDFLR